MPRQPITTTVSQTGTQSLHWGSALLACILALTSGTAGAVVNSGVSSVDFESQPPIVSDKSTPIAMLVMSRDHQLFNKVYNDYSDLDGDGSLETTYTHSIDYFGYFDPDKCYDYDGTKRRFVPVAFSANKYCDAINGADWSGNFLNWVSMARVDVVRKILYGGLRSTDQSVPNGDPAALTVLERTQLPHEAHSWAKYYNGADISRLTPFKVKTDTSGGDNDGVDDIDEGVTFCNTTNAATNDNSTTTTQPPLIRVAQGNYSLWASQERWQCTWSSGATEHGVASNANDSTQSGLFAHSSDPDRTNDGLKDGSDGPDFVARVEVCSDTTQIAADPKNNEGCKAYVSNAGVTTHKPIGLLQVYGETDLIDFGLVTGSYRKNISGGVLRKNAGTMTDEIDQEDGRFLTTPANGGIIRALSALRLFGYNYSDGLYDDDSGGITNTLDDCPFGNFAYSNDRCRSWGNPFSEMYVEALRYLAGQSPTPAYAADDTVLFPDLKTATWSDPLSTTNRCASLNVVAFNASVNTHDDNEVAITGNTNLGSAKTAKALTDEIGADEGIDGKPFFIGTTSNNSDQKCTGKTIDSGTAAGGLGQGTGICPESPTLSGSYQLAGAAWYAHTHDLRSALDGEQEVDTYGVSLATNVPNIPIPVPGSATGQTVTLLPAFFQFRDTLGPGGGLVDFQVVQPHTVNAATNTATGKFYINWEVNDKGSDYDQDEWGTLDYVIDGTAGTITINTVTVAQSSGAQQLFGFITSGTTQDGFHAISGSLGADFSNPAGNCTNPTTGLPRSKECDDCRALDESGGQHGIQSCVFTVGSSTADLLQDPLYYAAKWGGFVDLNGNDKPDQVKEWDKDTPADGPDNFFLVTQPQALEQALGNVFESILERISAGTAAAVVANSSSGIGAIYQAVYQPFIKDGANEVKWTGFVQSIFIDDLGLLREDTNQNQTLDDYSSTGDRIIDVFYDPVQDETLVQRFTSTDNGVSNRTPDGPPFPLKELKAIWKSYKTLDAITDPATNRVYDPSNTTNDRFIFTWIDSTSSGISGQVDTGETIPFEAASFDNTSDNFRYLNVANPADANDDGDDAGDIVNFIRGKEGITGFRNRTIDFDGDGTTEVLRVGDIVHSTPAIVGAPSSNFDALFGDDTYAIFRNQYRDRRQVTYVGANDGMIHAFNGGFFDSAALRFQTTPPGTTPSGNELPLGAELWGYVPANLLPELQYLTNPTYNHIYYMDGDPVVFDAKIFTPDATHPRGWGTVLVMGMRLGGGTIALDIDNDGTLGDVTTRPAYVVMDITDPEQPPVLIAEITDTNLGLTNSRPTVVKRRIPLAGDFDAGTNEWFLAFGSGPTDLDTATSSQNARVYLYDLVSKSFVSNFAGFDTGLTTSHVSGMTSVDWDNDYVDDAVYFGTDGMDAALTTPAGVLARIDVNSTVSASTVPTLLDAAAPFVSAPNVSVDDNGDCWVHAATGRLFVTSDSKTTLQNTVYGVKEPQVSGICPSSKQLISSGNTVATTELQDITGVRVFEDGSLTDPDGVLATIVPAIDTFDKLEEHIETNKAGWLDNLATFGSDPSTRSITRVVQAGSVLLYTTFTPSPDECDVLGTSQFVAVSNKTGTALPFAPIGLNSSFVNNGKDMATKVVDLGPGLSSAVAIHAGRRQRGKITAITQSSTAALQTQLVNLGLGTTSGRQSWREIIKFY